MSENTENEPLKLLKENVDAEKKVADARGFVDDHGLKKVDENVSKLSDLLEGRKRKALELSKELPFIRDEDIGTPSGGPVEVPVAATDAAAGGPPKASTSAVGSTIEFLCFGRLHRDTVLGFAASAPNDDGVLLEPSATPGRALYFRASIEREAVLLAGIADAIEKALAEKGKQEGNLGTLMKVAGDLLGGAPGTQGSAASADMKPFVSKVEEAYKKVDKAEISYADLHEAGRDLHKVRANLEAYLFQQLDKKGAPAAGPSLLSELPLMGSVPLPGELGSIVKTFRDVGGKLHDVFNGMLFGLSVGMLPAIKTACHDITLDVIKGGKSPIYPVWFEPLPKDAEERRREALKKTRDARRPLANYGMGDVLTGNVLKGLGGDEVNDALKTGVRQANNSVNDVAETPLEIIDFLSTKVPKVPGHRFLDAAFQGSTNDKAVLGGSEKLSEIAVAAFYSACAESVPGFMHGFVEDFVGYVFAVCVEFLRSTYRVLCALDPGAIVSTEQLVAAGTTHVLTHLLDFLTDKLGVDKLIEDFTINLKDVTDKVPKIPGINLPTAPISAAPIAAKLKELLVDKAKPLLVPVVDFAMSGLARRINERRGWAGLALTMEAHLSQLPAELALLFRDLFKPLWSFLTDTLMHVVSDVVGKALGPAASLLGVVGEPVGFAKKFIDQAHAYADQAQEFAKRAEEKADHLINELSSVTIGGDKGDQDIRDIGAAIGGLHDHVTKNPFQEKAEDEKRRKDEEARKSGASFFATRTRTGKGTPILPAELEKVRPHLLWLKSLPKPGSAAQAKAGAA